jgi:hypothetical protein
MCQPQHEALRDFGAKDNDAFSLWCEEAAKIDDFFSGLDFGSSRSLW